MSMEHIVITGQGTAQQASRALADAIEKKHVSHIYGNIWQGNFFEDPMLPVEFKSVVSLYPWQRLALNPTVLQNRVEYLMYDTEDLPVNEDVVLSAAQLTLAFARKGPVLVHCQAGLNRSGLVVATALWLNGMDPIQAIKLVREKRSPLALRNQRFLGFIEGLTHHGS